MKRKERAKSGRETNEGKNAIEKERERGKG